jgi:hypothetical protein
LGVCPARGREYRRGTPSEQSLTHDVVRREGVSKPASRDSGNRMFWLATPRRRWNGAGFQSRGMSGIAQS